MDKLLYRPKEACVMLGIGRSKLYELLRSGRLESHTEGRTRLIPADALCAYVALLAIERDAA
jgi:excisionase family DNA binding protein